MRKVLIAAAAALAVLTWSSDAQAFGRRCGGHGHGGCGFSYGGCGAPVFYGGCYSPCGSGFYGCGYYGTSVVYSQPVYGPVYGPSPTYQPSYSQPSYSQPATQPESPPLPPKKIKAPSTSDEPPSGFKDGKSSTSSTTGPQTMYIFGQLHGRLPDGSYANIPNGTYAMLMSQKYGR
jgi:hypothetical protein